MQDSHPENWRKYFDLDAYDYTKNLKTLRYKQMLRIFILVTGLLLIFGSLLNFFSQLRSESKKAKYRGAKRIPAYERECIAGNLVWTVLGVFMFAAGLES
jgi:hypothetical protein